MEIGELWISRCRLSTKEQAKENGDSAKVQIGRMRKAAKVERIEERIRGRRAAARKEEKGKKMVAKEIPRTCWTCGKTGHIAAWCRKGGNKKLYAVDEDDGENAEESTENEEDLQAWCLLEESENEQWQEVISKQNKRRVKKDNQASLLSIENSHNSNLKKIVEVKDKRVKVRVAMDSGAAGQNDVSTSSLSEKRHRRSLWPQMESESKTWVRKQFHSRQTTEVHNSQKCKCCQTPHFNARGRPSWKHCGAG